MMVASPMFAAQPEKRDPSTVKEQRLCAVPRSFKAPEASRAAKLPLHGATIQPAISDGDYDCRIYEQVDAECYQQCVSELGFTAKKQCRASCTYTVIECYTFPGVI
jgi:hypothetical protein